MPNPSRAAEAVLTSPSTTLTSFFGGIGGTLAERGSAQLFAPPTLFWGGGLAAWLIHAGSWEESGQRLVDWFGDLSSAEQILVVLGATLLLAASQIVAELVSLPVLRILEGYWPRPFRGAHRQLVARQSRKLKSDEARLQRLAAKQSRSGLTSDESIEYAVLDEALRLFPVDPSSRMPTRLGNVLRSGEIRPRDRYGLDPIVCWTRLWLVLPDDARTELAEARRQLDQTVIVLIWGALLVVWVFLTWWALLAAAAVVTFAYWWAVQRAMTFTNLIEATFDVHRVKLYDALRLPKPTNPSDEAVEGERVNLYLWRGNTEDLSFVSPDDQG